VVTVTVRLWPVLAVRGLLALLFGCVALAWPDVTVYALVLLFGAYALVDGVSRLLAVLRPVHPGGRRMAELTGGLLGIVLGIVTLLWPGATALALAVLIGVWAVLSGATEIWAAIRLRRVIAGELLLALIGLVSVLVGLLLVVRPDIGAVTVARVIGVYALVASALLLMLAWRVRRLELPPAAVIA
jgi:uncharacterized membrane protein HdeD (DUF308 family)